MKKYAFLKIFSIALVVLVSLVFLLGGTKPVQYTWKAVILDSSLNLAGGLGGVYDSDYGGWVYNDGDESANVAVFIRTYSSRGTNTFTPVFILEVLTPTQIGLQGVAIDSFGYDQSLNSCGFPGLQGSTLPSCWQSFLNQPQPRAGYQSASFMHEGARCMTQEEADFTKMDIGDTRVMRLSFQIRGQNIMGNCDDCDPTNYHQVDGDAHGYLKGGNYDIYLTREDENKWKVIVNTAFDNQDHNASFPDAFSWQDDKIWESYCECVYQKVGKRNVLTKYIRQSSWARAHIAYEILFIRTPK